jgi:hypothetical protein
MFDQCLIEMPVDHGILSVVRGATKQVKAI